jgi:hypothetical protein
VPAQPSATEDGVSHTDNTLQIRLGNAEIGRTSRAAGHPHAAEAKLGRGDILHWKMRAQKKYRSRTENVFPSYGRYMYRVIAKYWADVFDCPGGLSVMLSSVTVGLGGTLVVPFPFAHGAPQSFQAQSFTS